MKTATAKKQATGQPEPKMVTITFEEFEETFKMRSTLSNVNKILKEDLGKYVEADGPIYTLSMLTEKLDNWWCRIEEREGYLERKRLEREGGAQ